MTFWEQIMLQLILENTNPSRKQKNMLIKDNKLQGQVVDAELRRARQEQYKADVTRRKSERRDKLIRNARQRSQENLARLIKTIEKNTE